MSKPEVKLKVKLISDATFGRGDGVAGLIDTEVEYEAATGLPFIRGRVLKGLLTEECANILFALGRGDHLSRNSRHRSSQHWNTPLIHGDSSVQCPNAACSDLAVARLEKAALYLFGESGSTLGGDGKMQVGSATLPEDLHRAVAIDIARQRLTPARVLGSLTAIRRQTSIDEKSGAPETGSLRSARVVLRETLFCAPLDFTTIPEDDALALLAACVLSLRRGGSARNRGRGRLKAWLNDEEYTRKLMVDFEQIIAEAA